MNSNPLLMSVLGNHEILAILFLLLALIVPVGIAVVVAARVRWSRGLDMSTGNRVLRDSYHAAGARMQELQALLDQGAISKEEYRERRRGIIAGI